MSADAVNIHAQVESVLAALVKVATVELTKLFESRCRAWAATVEVGRADNGKGNESPDSVSSAERTRSIGVQVDIQPPFELSYGDCSTECEMEMKVQDCLNVLFAGNNPLVKEAMAEIVTVPEFSILETDSGPLADTTLDDEKCVPTQSPPAKKTPPAVQPDPSHEGSFTCPLTLKSPAPQPDSSETPVQAEPPRACASTTASSPSLCDGALTTAPGGLWLHVTSPKTKKNLTMKLKVASSDKKLTSTCVVQLVDMETAEKSETKHQESDGDGKKPPVPKDLRRHQGAHTGHRLCCFTPCGEGVWRLQKILARSRDGYACAACGKAFKHRKILRRHERFHTGERPYSCSKCSKAFALRKSLRRHVRFHTGETPHKCTHCDKSFRLRVNLKTHLRFHTGEKPYQCDLCGKKFRLLGNLDRHKRTPCGILVPSFRTIAGF
ncbi:uncharacterized protein LOC144043801 [Vanacampus margaritifer]